MIDEKLVVQLRSLGFSEQMPGNEVVRARKDGRAYVRVGANVLATYITYPAGEVREFHSHPEIRLTFVRSGRAWYSREGEKTEVGPGDVIVVLPNEKHSLAVGHGEALNICELVIDTSTDS